MDQTELEYRFYLVTSPEAAESATPERISEAIQFISHFRTSPECRDLVLGLGPFESLDEHHSRRFLVLETISWMRLDADQTDSGLWIGLREFLFARCAALFRSFDLATHLAVADAQSAFALATYRSDPSIVNAALSMPQPQQRWRFLSAFFRDVENVRDVRNALLASGIDSIIGEVLMTPFYERTAPEVWAALAAYLRFGDVGLADAEEFRERLAESRGDPEMPLRGPERPLEASGEPKRSDIRPSP
jgi:hypothetical protein